MTSCSGSVNCLWSELPRKPTNRLVSLQRCPSGAGPRRQCKWRPIGCVPGHRPKAAVPLLAMPVLSRTSDFRPPLPQADRRKSTLLHIRAAPAMDFTPTRR